VDYTINIVGFELRQGQGVSAKDKLFSRGCDISGVWLVMLRRLPLVERRLAIVGHLILSLSIRMVWVSSEVDVGGCQLADAIMALFRNALSIAAFSPKLRAR
jgi:hypothetical protein